MSECTGANCTHPDCLTPAQYGTGIHYPHCIDRRCTGCMPPPPEHLMREIADPVVKYDGAGQPVRASQIGNRAQRRAATRAARRRR
jgi:hypothetical protein